MGIKKTLASIVLAGACVLGGGDRARGDLYEYHNTGDDDNLTGVSIGYWPAQTFTIGTTGPNEDFNIDEIRVKLSRKGGPENCFFYIRETLEGKPFGPNLSSGVINGDDITLNQSGEWYSIDMSPFNLQASKQYALVVGRYSGNEEDIDSISWFRDLDNGYIGGNKILSTNSGLTWDHPYVGEDLMFEIHGVPEPTTMGLLGLGAIGLLRRKKNGD